MMTLRQGLEKRANWLAGLIGTARAGNLTDQEKDQLRKKYGLNDDANLMLRNTGRGMVGGTLGAMAAVPLATAGWVHANMRGGRTALQALDATGRALDRGRVPIGLRLIPGIGALIGAKMMTDKYSKSALDS